MTFIIENMSVEEINKTVRESLSYDDYKYQSDNNILITEPYRAEVRAEIERDSFYCYPKRENVVTKLAFATEEIYQLQLSKKKSHLAK